MEIPVQYWYKRTEKVSWLCCEGFRTSNQMDALSQHLTLLLGDAIYPVLVHSDPQLKPQTQQQARRTETREQGVNP